jgi:hypothetical protein
MLRNSQKSRSPGLLAVMALVPLLLVLDGGFGHPVPSLFEGQARSSSLNKFIDIGNDIQLRHPSHIADFTNTGLEVAPRRGGPIWNWHLENVNGQSGPLPGIETGAVVPSRQGNVVRYDRGALVEEYHAKSRTLEQRFVLPSHLPLMGDDLIVSGSVHSDGEYEKSDEGWAWRNDEGVIHLGDVKVYDALGKVLPASMEVEAQATHIRVSGPALALATYPVTIDPEIGADDFRISDTGPGVEAFDAFAASVAHNTTANQYIVVWYGNEEIGGETNIYGQILDASGAEVGPDFQISQLGTEESADKPTVSYNSVSNEYLVVWLGSLSVYGQRLDAAGNEIGADDFVINQTSVFTGTVAIAYSAANNEYLVAWESLNVAFDVFVRRLDADGIPIDPAELQISDMGGGTAGRLDATWNSIDGEYLVVWAGRQESFGTVEVYGQRLDNSGAEVGADDFQIGDIDSFGDLGGSVAVSYNSTGNEFLVVWNANDTSGADQEIYGQRLDNSGNQVGANDFKISDMGPQGDSGFFAFEPSIVYNSSNDEYFITWQGNDAAGADLYIFGQRIAPNGANIGNNDFLISDVGFDSSDLTAPGDIGYATVLKGVAYNSISNEYLVVWNGDAAIDGNFEIFGQRLDAGANEIGATDFKISDMESSDALAFWANSPDVAYSSFDRVYLVVWQGDDEVDGDFEIFGQVLDSAGNEISIDFQISHMGPDGNASYEASDPSVVYNWVTNEFLVTWLGRDDIGVETLRVYGQRLDTTGMEVGVDDFPIGNDNSSISRRPALTYNGTTNEFLVVWRNFGSNYRVLAQRLDGAGNEIGADDFVVSGTNSAIPGDVSAAWNADANEYLVVWSADDQPSVPDVEIYGQRLDASGNELGQDDFRISQTGPDGDFDFSVMNPSLAYNSAEQEYLVVWQATNSLEEGSDEYEIFGQRLTSEGTPIGADDFRISDMGPDGDADWDAFRPSVAHNTVSNEYLVVWYGSDDEVLLMGPDSEEFGQRLDGVGNEIGVNDFPISDTSVPWSNSIIYNADLDQYLVVWSGANSADPIVPDQTEIFGQLLSFPTVVLRFSDAYGAPGGQAVVAVTLETNEPLTGMQFRIQPQDDGDPTELVQFLGAISHVAHFGFDVTSSTDENGVTSILLINFSSATALPPGETTVLELFFDIDENTPTDREFTLSVTENLLTDADVESRVHNVETGLIRTGRPGDPSLDGVVNILDIAKVVRYILNILPTPTGFELFVADANGDQELDVRDAISMINIFLFGESIPPSKATAISPATTATIGFGDPLQSDSDQILVPIVISTDGTVFGLQANVSFDQNTMVMGEPRLVGRAEGFTIHYQVTDGTLRFVVFSTEGHALQPGSGTEILIPIGLKDGTAAAVTLSDVVLSGGEADAIPVHLGTSTVRASSAPESFALRSAYPNPFNPSTTIEYEVPERSHIQLSIYNLLGQEVTRLVDQIQEPGRYSVAWNGRNSHGQGVASGIYLYRLRGQAGYTETRRMTLLK